LVTGGVASRLRSSLPPPFAPGDGVRCFVDTPPWGDPPFLASEDPAFLGPGAGESFLAPVRPRGERDGDDDDDDDDRERERGMVLRCVRSLRG
jgi:hypothetical protein